MLHNVDEITLAFDPVAVNLNLNLKTAITAW